MQQRYLLAAVLLTSATLGGLWLARNVAHAGGGCRGEPVTTGDGVTVTMDVTCFSPTLLYVEPGDTVTWVNGPDYAHMVTGANGSWGTYDEVAPGGSVSQTFDDAGTYPYYCLLHQGMIGAVVVGDGRASPPGSVAAAPVRAAGADALLSAAPTTSDAGGGGSERWVIAVLGIAAGVAALSGVGGFVLGWRRT